MFTHGKATELTRRVINKNIKPEKRSIKSTLIRTNQIRKQPEHSLDTDIKDDDSSVILVQFAVNRCDGIYITGVIKTLLELFPDCLMYFRNNETLEVFLLPEIPTLVKTMKYRGSFEEKTYDECIPSSEFIVWECNKDAFLIVMKSSNNEFLFTDLLQNNLLYSNRKVRYEKLIKLFVRRILNAPVISLQKYTICPLDKYQYALSSSLNSTYGLLATQNAELAPSGAMFTNTKHGAISAHSRSVHASDNASTPFQNAVEKSTQRCSSAEDVMVQGVISSQNFVTNNISSLASAVPINETSYSLTPILTGQTPFKRRKNLPRYPRYVTESSRHQSYFNWFHVIPTEKECVIAGFFYTGEFDLIRCFQCGIGLKDFSPADDPMAEHIRNSESCLYLEAMFGLEGLTKLRKELDQSNPENTRQRQYTDFQRNLGATSSHHTSRSLQYSTIESRILSYESDKFRSKKSPEELAEAGLFYTGVRDEVRCFSCNGGLSNWEKHDDPWIEHCKWFPACAFARETKGDAFIEQVQHSANAPTTMLNDATNLSAEVHHYNDLDLDMDLVTMKTICMDEMEFTAEIFDEAVYHLQLDANHHPNIEDIINRIDKIKKDTAVQYTSAKKSESLYEESQRLKSIVKCSKCKINDSNALFLPCAHHVMCIACAHDTKRCPVCNRGISDFVRTFMG
ncbi:baculoviral IAP repeat-containing protein 3-like [Dreissena polymorpha]|uniref:baculoviral IAP repeat-containing protein 3-like n=1 Tax=Dreissena polymorpha TaxID=45954 RepID=UPI0022647D81|nr:baculoviral IAP repeat-containing protein 3-like [Dreissena polymorpha]